MRRNGARTACRSRSEWIQRVSWSGQLDSNQRPAVPKAEEERFLLIQVLSCCVQPPVNQGLLALRGFLRCARDSRTVSTRCRPEERADASHQVVPTVSCS